MCLRAILTAFSTASAPEFSSTDFFAKSPGVCSASNSARVTYDSYGLIVNIACVSSPSCALAAATTAGSVCPIVMTPMPEPRSMNWLPSTSTTIAPWARSMKTGIAEETPEATTASRRSWSAIERGPGTAVTMRRSAAMVLSAMMMRA